MLVRLVTAALVLVGYLAVPAGALAHGFGQRIDLPIPISLYYIGGGATVIISFILIGLISEEKGRHRDYPRYNLLNLGWFRVIAKSNAFLWIIKTLSVLVLLLIIIAGFLGEQNAASNIAPTTVWILFGVGITYISAFLGNIWRLINPWKNIFELAEKMAGKKLSLDNPYPRRWGVWPAFLLFFGYRWVENVFPNSAVPASLSIFVLAYSLLTLAAMAYFGKKQWLKRGEAFSVFFELLSRFSITEYRKVGGREEFNLRPPGVGLLAEKEADFSHTAFVLFMLASIAFDGLKATPFLQKVSEVLSTIGLAEALVGTLEMLIVLAFFGFVYLVFSTLVGIFARSKEKSLIVSYRFIYSLLPIAIAYEVAHFITLLLVEGQRIIYLVSDPFGFGWNLLGTAGYKLNYQVVNLKTLWNVQVALIVLGHIIAVYVAHIIALRVFKIREKAVMSQYPMLGLMVLYTISSLWIIAQPIVAGGD